MINIFAKRAFLNTSPNASFESKEKSYHGRGHMQRVSSMIRGDQISNYLKDNIRLNPEVFNYGDTSIYVKPHVSGTDFEFKTMKSYIDIIDGWGLIPLLEKNPEVGVIACSKQDLDKLSFLPNKKVFIPQHHCNYDRIWRDRDGIKTIGIIGTEDAFKWIPEGLEENLKERGINLLKYSKFFSRQDIIDFYKQIDIQLVWRPYRMKLSNPLKIVNATSFGIPTIAYNESVFEEVEGCYRGVKTSQEFLKELDYLIEHPAYYHLLKENCQEKSEEYHIGKVAELYKQL